jgi:hypothetical protein
MVIAAGRTSLDDEPVTRKPKPHRIAEARSIVVAFREPVSRSSFQLQEIERTMGLE